MIDDFAFLVYTNENYLPIADLTMMEFDKWCPENSFKRYLVSNKFTDYQFTTKKFISLESQTNFDGAGNHFGETLSKALVRIPEEYIFFLCDDYFVIDKPNLENLKDLLKIIKKSEIDFFSFASMGPNSNWQIFDEKEGLLSDIKLFNIPESYQYRHSVQPCIWKKSSLLEILNHNKDLPIHHLDTTNILNKKGFGREFSYEKSVWGEYPNNEGYGFKCICTDFKAYDELFEYRYFIFPYVEIVRHGHFNLWSETHTKKLILKLIEERDLKNNQYYKKFLL